MEGNNKLCSSTEHQKINAISYCPKCEINMCNKCEIHHSKLLKNHEIINLGNNNEDIFTGFCNEKGHSMEFEFFCKDHNQLCCAACIAKIKNDRIGKHKDCNVVSLEDIKEEKINKLNENIKMLEKLSENIVDSINELKEIIEKKDKNKEELIIKIQNIFTKLRNELNNREDQLLLEIENKYNDLYVNEDILKQFEKLPNKIKLLLEKGKKIDKKNLNIKLNSILYQCLNIENNINDINIMNEKVKKCKDAIKIKFYFYPEKEEDIYFLEKIKTFGKICLPTKIKEYNLIKKLELNSGICSVIILSNKDIAIGKRNGELIIFDPIEFKEIVKVQAHSGGNTSIYSLLELKDKSIITCGGNKTMKNYIYNIEDKKLLEAQELFCKNNSDYICRVVELPNNNLVSSDNNNILIWQKDENKKFKIIKEIIDFGGVMQHLILLNDKYVVCHNNSGVLRIYNSLDNFKLEKEIKKLISNGYMHRFCSIDSDLFCLSGDQYIYLLSISKMDIISSIKVDNINFFSIMLLSNHTLLCGDQNYFCQFKIENKREIKLISKTDKVHSTIIWQLAHLDSNRNSEKIISVSDDQNIKIFELIYDD